MHKNNFGQTLNLQSAVVTLNIRSWSSKSNELFSVSKQCIYNASLMEKNPLVQNTELRKGRIYRVFFKDDEHENEVTLKVRSKSPNSYQHFILSQ